MLGVCSAFAGLRFGSLPRAQKLGLTPEVLRGLSHKGVSSRRKVGQQAVDELFDSAVQEVVDETNVPRSALGEPLLSGLVRQGNSFGAPTAGEQQKPRSIDRSSRSINSIYLVDLSIDLSNRSI